MVNLVEREWSGEGKEGEGVVEGGGCEVKEGRSEGGREGGRESGWV